MRAYTNPTWLKKKTPHLLEIQNTILTASLIGASKDESRVDRTTHAASSPPQHETTHVSPSDIELRTLG
jgi:hypothetical protein